MANPLNPASAPPAEEGEFNIREYWDIFLKRWPVFGITVLLVFSVRAYILFHQPITYMTSAKAMIAPSTIQVRSLTGSFFMQRYEAQNELELMKSDATIKRAVVIFKEESKNTLAISPGEFKGSFSVDVLKDKNNMMTNIITIAAQSRTPEKALYIIPSLIKAYTEETNEYRKETVKKLYDALTEQLSERRKELELAERELTKFVVGHDIIARGIEVGGKLTDERGDIQQIRSGESALHEKYLILKSQRINKEDFLEEVKKHVAKDEVAALSVVAKREEKLVDMTLRDQLYEKERTLSKLLLTQSDLHPNVIEARGEVEEARRRISQELEKAVGSAERDIDALKKEEVKLYTLIKEGLTDAMVEYGSLKRDLEAKREIYNAFIKELQQFDLSGKLREIQPIKILEAPTRPAGSGGNKRKGMTQSLIFAIFIGIGAVIVSEYIDTSIKNVEDAENILGAAVLAVIPRCRKKPDEIYLGDASIRNPKSIMSESFRTLRTNIKFVTADKNIKSIMITSVLPGDGKTTVACNLASVMAMSGERIVLLDGDLRRGSIHRQFNLDNSKGLSSLLSGEEAVEGFGASDTGVQSLKIITSGSIPPNPSELLGSGKMDLTLEGLKKSYNAIVLDSPPLLAVSDSLSLASKVDGAILIILANKTSKKAAVRGLRMLRNTGVDILGVVINAVGIKGAGYYGGYYYNYRYGYVSK